MAPAAPLGCVLAALLAALHQVLVVEGCARNLDRSASSPRPVKATTPRVLSLQIGDALYLRLESVIGAPSSTPSPLNTISPFGSRRSTSTPAPVGGGGGGGLPTTSATAMYTNRYDHVAIENVLRNPRLMKNFHWCVMGRGPCTSEGSELKRIIPEALKSDCARCTETQKIQAGKVLLYLIEHRPEWWKELMDKYDSDGSIRKRYEYEIE